MAANRFLYYFYDALVDFFNGAIAIDYRHTQRLAGRDRLILIEDPAIKLVVFLFKPVFIFPGRRHRPLIASPRTRQRCLKVGQ